MHFPSLITVQTWTELFELGAQLEKEQRPEFRGQSSGVRCQGLGGAGARTQVHPADGTGTALALSVATALRDSMTVI